MNREAKFTSKTAKLVDRVVKYMANRFIDAWHRAEKGQVVDEVRVRTFDYNKGAVDPRTTNSSGASVASTTLRSPRISSIKPTTPS